MYEEKILVLDFGSQYTQLIARRVRECKVYSEIFPFNASIEKIKNFNPKGIILSGGPSSVYDKNAPIPDIKIFELGMPVLGICYGMQLMAYLSGGKVTKAVKREYGKAELIIDSRMDIFEGIPKKTTVWMSHGDRIARRPIDFRTIAHTANSPVAAMANNKKRFYALQFHPEVVHTEKGFEILNNFLFRICRCKPAWTIRSFIDTAIEEIREKIGENKVVCGISGGVDSSITAILVHRAVRDQLTWLFVDNGVLRAGEAEKVERTLRRHFHMNINCVDASKRFLNKLKGVIDPELKRKIIGNEFIKVFESEARKIKGVKFLAQGTLYPDVIESVPFKGPSATIKSHHNVGGLLKRMKLKLIEPLRELFKDEVRVLGKELDIPDEIISRQPFPGPGLAIRARKSLDGMTADWARIPYDVLERISNRIINEVKGVNRVVYDISSKPPSTIEWE